MKHIILLLQLLLLTSLNLFGQDFERYKTLVDTTITSEYLGFNKNISITVPIEWQKDLDRDFPLIIIFDRQNQRSHDYMLYTIDYLTSNEQMPASILVSIASEEQYRYLETSHKATTNDGLAEENEKFLFEELIPLLETHYKASSFRLFIGHSRYGYFTTALLNSRITELNGVIALSPFFTQKNVDLTDTIGRLDDKVFESHKYYYFGIGNDYPSDFFKMDSIIKKLTNPHLSTEGFFFKEADHNVTPGLTISSSLYKLFEVWSKKQSLYLSNEQTDLSIINALKNAIQSHYGSSLELSLGVLNGKGWYFYNEGEYNKAIEAWEIVLETYPNFSEAYLYIIAAQIQLKKDYKQTVDRFNNSLSSSLIYSEVEKQELVEELANLIQ